MKQLSIYEDLSLGGSAMPSQADLEAPRLENQEINQTQTPANVTEIIITHERTNAFQMLLPMLTHLNQDQRWLAWVDPPIQMLKKWREQHQGLLGNDIMVIRSDKNQSALDLSEKALRAGTCHAVIVWSENLSQDQFEALEAASAEGNSHGIVLRSR